MGLIPVRSVTGRKPHKSPCVCGLLGAGERAVDFKPAQLLSPACCAQMLAEDGTVLLLSSSFWPAGLGSVCLRRWA